VAVMFFLIFWLGGSHITGTIAKNKGGSYGFFFVGSLLMMIIALPMALMMKPTNEAMCPHCRSRVALGATVCAKCSRDIAYTPVEQHRHAA
jgi:DNA-directed RNA polymerase subunit RPC12/RpoP